MALTVRDRYLLASGFLKGVEVTKLAFDIKDKDFLDADTFEIALDWMRWVEDENLSDLEKEFNMVKDHPYFQDLEQQSPGSDADNDGSETPGTTILIA